MARNRPRFSLIEGALLLCLLAVVLAIFVPTFMRRVRTNKISEASELLAQMSRGAQAYFGTAWSSSNRDCLPPSAGPTPETPTVDPQTVGPSSAPIPGPDRRSPGPNRTLTPFACLRGFLAQGPVSDPGTAPRCSVLGGVVPNLRDRGRMA